MALTPALAQMRTHRVRGVAHHYDRTPRPLARLIAVVEVVAEHVGGVGRGEHGWDRVGPACELGLQVSQLTLRFGPALRGALGGEPVGELGSERNMAELETRAHRFAGQVGIDDTVGHSTPGGVPDIAVVQGAVQVSGHHRAGAVGADDRGRLAGRANRRG